MQIEFGDKNSVDESFLKLTGDYFSAISCFSESFYNVLAYGSVYGPLLTLVDIEEQKALKKF